MKIKTAVIPVAGKGTRFLPATKETPKEMLPILNMPMIHYVVSEAVNSGIERVVFVTSTGKESIENYFDRNMALESFLDKAGKSELKNKIVEIGSMIEIVTVRQKEQLGLGHAILCAEKLVSSENFAVLLGDDLVLNPNPVTKQLINVSESNGNKSVIGVMEVPKEETDKYGIVQGDFLNSENKTLKMEKMVEKPSPESAPSNLATPGRYILTPEIFKALKEIKRGVGGEYQLTDAINLLAEKDDVYAHIFEGDRYDTGSLKGYLNATVEFALRDDDLRKYTLDLLKEKLEKWDK